MDLQDYLDSSPHASLAISLDGKVLYGNPLAVRMFGYEPSELAGLPVEDLMPTRFRKEHMRHRQRYGASGEGRLMYGRELTALRKDGSEFPVEVGLGASQGESQLLVLAVINDISERRRARDELAQVQDELLRSNADLQQFVAVASHDLQEPLRLISNYLQLFERRYGHSLDDDGREFIRFASEGAVRMKSLLQDLLQFSRAGTQATKFHATPSRALVDTALNNLRLTIAESGASVTVDTLPTIVADSGLIIQVFQNLIGNGVKFHAPGAVPQVQISAKRQEGDWVFAVTDQGIGIDPSHSGRIFQIFERLHGEEEYQGSGIGLAISKKIVERHGGRIWFESVPDKGSTFYFSLPVDPARPIPNSVRAATHV